MKFVTSFNDTKSRTKSPAERYLFEPRENILESEVYRYAQLARCAEARRKSAKVVVKFNRGASIVGILVRKCLKFNVTF